MVITKEQLADRINGIGGSDVPSLFGESKWKSAYDLWLEKTGRVSPEPAGEIAEMGNIFEPGILAVASRRLGRPVVSCTGTWTRGNLRVHPDGMVGSEARGAVIVQAKMSAASGWGEDGSPMVPESVYLQIQAEMLACESSQAWAVRLFAGFRTIEVTMHPIAANVDVQAAIESRVEEFWMNVVNDVPPKDSTPSVDLLSMMRRSPEIPPVEIPEDVVAAYLEAKSAASSAESALDEKKAALILALGDAEVGRTASGVGVSFKSVTVRRLSSARVRELAPEIAEQATETSGYRKLIVTQPKPKKAE